MTNSADPDLFQLIWIYTVCKDRVYPDSAGQGLTLSTLLAKSDDKLIFFVLFPDVEFDTYANII